MRQPILPFFSRLHRDRRGAVAMLTAAVIVALAGVGAVAVDVGYAVNAQRQLQASADAAALAGARDIGSTTNDPVATATSYSAVAGNKNAPSNVNVTMASGYPVLKCYTSIGVTCVSGKSGVPAANGIQVKQQATVPTFFGNAIGISSLSISATATAGAKGGKATPMDVMIIVDTTSSMNTADFELQRRNTNCLRTERCTGHAERVLAVARPGRPAGVSGHDECDGLEGLHLPDQQSHHRVIRQPNAMTGVPDRRAVDRLQNIRRDNQPQSNLQCREGSWRRLRLLGDQGSRR